MSEDKTNAAQRLEDQGDAQTESYIGEIETTTETREAYLAGLSAPPALPDIEPENDESDTQETPLLEISETVGGLTDRDWKNAKKNPRPRRKVKRSRNIAEEKEMEVMQKLINKVESIDSLDELSKLAQKYHNAEYVIKTRGGVKAIKGKVGSQELANAINMKKDILVAEDFKLEIENTPNSVELDRLASRIERAGYIKKKVTGNYADNWIAHATNKPGSEIVTPGLNARREELSLEEKLSRISRDIQAMNEDIDLEKHVWKNLHNRMKMVNKITIDHPTKKGESDWDVVEIDEKPGSAEVVKMIKERREAIPREKVERTRREIERNLQ